MSSSSESKFNTWPKQGGAVVHVFLKDELDSCILFNSMTFTFQKIIKISVEIFSTNNYRSIYQKE